MKKLLIISTLLLNTTVMLSQQVEQPNLQYKCSNNICGIYNMVSIEPIWVEYYKYALPNVVFNDVITNDIIINNKTTKITYYINNNIIVLVRIDGKFFI